MTGTGTHLCTHERFDIRGAFLVDEEADVPLGRKAHHDAKPVPLRGVEQWARRRGENSDSVQSIRRHLSEISLHNFEFGKLVSVYVRHKRPVRDAANVQLLVTDEEELAVNTWASARTGYTQKRVRETRGGSDGRRRVREGRYSAHG
jgi:hypothetical protein